MSIVDIVEATQSLASLIERAEAGEEIQIYRDGKPVVHLRPCASHMTESKPQEREQSQTSGETTTNTSIVTEFASSSSRNLAGIFQGHPWLDIDLDAPLDDEVARAFGMID